MNTALTEMYRTEQGFFQPWMAEPLGCRYATPSTRLSELPQIGTELQRKLDAKGGAYHGTTVSVHEGKVVLTGKNIFVDLKLGLSTAHVQIEVNPHANGVDYTEVQKVLDELLGATH